MTTISFDFNEFWTDIRPEREPQQPVRVTFSNPLGPMLRRTLKRTLREQGAYVPFHRFTLVDDAGTEVVAAKNIRFEDNPTDETLLLVRGTFVNETDHILSVAALGVFSNTNELSYRRDFGGIAMAPGEDLTLTLTLRFPV